MYNVSFYRILENRHISIIIIYMYYIKGPFVRVASGPNWILTDLTAHHLSSIHL